MTLLDSHFSFLFFFKTKKNYKYVLNPRKPSGTKKKFQKLIHKVHICMDYCIELPLLLKGMDLNIVNIYGDNVNVNDSMKLSLSKFSRLAKANYVFPDD